MYTQVIRNLFFLPMAHTTETMAPEGTPQNLASQEGGTKQHVATKKNARCYM
jgi:hypothetical protein